MFKLFTASIISISLIGCSTTGKVITTKEGNTIETSYESEQLDTMKVMVQEQMKMYAQMMEKGRTEIKCEGPCDIKIASFDPTKIQQPQMPKNTNGNDVAIALIDKSFSVVGNVLPVYFGWKFGSQILETAFESSGDKFTNSFNDRSTNISDSYKDQSTVYTDVGNNKSSTDNSIYLSDVGNNKSSTDNSINDSNKPIDNSVNGSYNPVDNSINSSYNPDNRNNSVNDSNNPDNKTYFNGI